MRSATSSLVARNTNMGQHGHPEFMEVTNGFVSHISKLSSPTTNASLLRLHILEADGIVYETPIVVDAIVHDVLASCPETGFRSECTITCKVWRDRFPAPVTELRVHTVAV